MTRPGHEDRAFRWSCEHSTTELLSHPVISPTTFHLTPTRLHKHYIWGTYLRLTYDKIVEKKQTKQSKANLCFLFLLMIVSPLLVVFRYTDGKVISLHVVFICIHFRLEPSWHFIVYSYHKGSSCVDHVTSFVSHLSMCSCHQFSSVKNKEHNV